MLQGDLPAVVLEGLKQLLGGLVAGGERLLRAAEGEPHADTAHYAQQKSGAS